MIHNGIVENYLELRAALLARGHQLRSQTDTELISHLIEERIKAGLGLTEAVRRSVGNLRGSFSIVVLSETEPGKLVAAKTATPLVLGLGDGENFVASDIPAILNHTRKTVVLDDGELAEITAHSVRIMKFDGTPVTRLATYRMGCGRGDQGRLQALSAQGDKRAAAGVDRHAGRSRGCRIVRGALRRGAFARGRPATRSGES